MESSTDNHSIYKIEGMNPTDHNVITATINTEVEPTTRVISKWKTGTRCNEEIQKQWQQTNPRYRSYTTLQKTNSNRPANSNKNQENNNKQERKSNKPNHQKKETNSKKQQEFFVTCMQRKNEQSNRTKRNLLPKPNKNIHPHLLCK